MFECLVFVIINIVTSWKCGLSTLKQTTVLAQEMQNGDPTLMSDMFLFVPDDPIFYR